jgi:hypothetical protein
VKTTRKALLLVVTGSAIAAGAAEPHVEKRLGSVQILLPQVIGFSAACEQDKALAQRAASLTPKTSEFLTCFVEAKKWRDYQAGKASDLYPFIAVAVAHPHPSGPLTLSEFEKLRHTARAELGSLVANLAAAQARLREQDAKLATSGGDLKRENYRQALKGFFEVPGETRSFSFLVGRSSVLHEGGQSTQLCETNAVSTIFLQGKLLGLMVVDDCTSSADGARSQSITKTWLQAFWHANGGAR